MVKRRLPWLVVLVSLGGCGEGHDPAAISGFRVEAILGDELSQDAGFTRAQQPIAFEFPADYGSHRDFRSEWWYLTAVLSDPAAQEYGVQFTVFRQGLAPRLTPRLTPTDPAPDALTRWSTQSAFMAHVAVTDVGTGGRWVGQRFGRDRPEIAGVTAQPFHVWVDGWSMRSAGESLLPMTVTAQHRGAAIELQIQPGGRMLRQGDAGLSRKGEDNASYYYSITRLPIQGHLTLDGRRIAVTGLGWLDREWSTSVLGDAHEGWDWFALHFDDGTDLMVYRLRREDRARDPFDAGKLVYPDGRDRTLVANDFDLLELDYWTDETGVVWPRQWRLEVDGRTLVITAAVDDQIMDTIIRYWEGVVHVADVDGKRLGQGYMELTGYR